MRLQGDPLSAEKAGALGSVEGVENIVAVKEAIRRAQLDPAQIDEVMPNDPPWIGREADVAVDAPIRMAAARALGAHLNGIETFPFFATAATVPAVTAAALEL